MLNKLLKTTKYTLLAPIILLFVCFWLFALLYGIVGLYTVVTGTEPLTDRGVLTKYTTNNSTISLEFDGEREYTVHLSEKNTLTVYNGQMRPIAQAFTGGYYYFYIWDTSIWGEVPTRYGLSVRGLP